MAKVGRRLLRNNTGAALVEYALIIAGVALIGAAAVSVFGNKVTDMLTTAASLLPGQHADSTPPIVSGSIETSPTATGFDRGTSPAGPTLSNNVGADGSVSALVVEPKNR